MRASIFIGLLVIASFEASHGSNTPPPGKGNEVQIRGDIDPDFLTIGPDYWTTEYEHRSAPSIILLRKGNKALHQGDEAKAISIWRSVIAKHPNTPSWNMAILNAGRVLKKNRRYKEAIECLKTLLSNENHKKLGKSTSVLGFNTLTETPMQAYLYLYNNDWHSASVLVSECYERLGNIRMALHYAVLSRDKYEFQTGCFSGNAWAMVSAVRNERIAAFKNSLPPIEETSFLSNCFGPTIVGDSIGFNCRTPSRVFREANQRRVVEWWRLSPE